MKLFVRVIPRTIIWMDGRWQCEKAVGEKSNGGLSFIVPLLQLSQPVPAELTVWHPSKI